MAMQVAWGGARRTGVAAGHPEHPNADAAAGPSMEFPFWSNGFDLISNQTTSLHYPGAKPP
jgi:hypothetical protein